MQYKCLKQIVSIKLCKTNVTLTYFRTNIGRTNSTDQTTKKQKVIVKEKTTANSNQSNTTNDKEHTQRLSSTIVCKI